LTIHGQSTLFTTIRQLEFTVLRITQQLDELINAVQHATSGKLPMTIDPVTLNSILKNISLRLQDGYELVAGTKFENIHLHYDCIRTAIIGDPYHIKIILSVPLKTVNRHFMLYKILALPTRISNSMFIQNLPDFLYFGIDHIQRNYILLTDVEFSYCTRCSFTICPANKAIYSTQMITCGTSLFFQKTNSLQSCSRRLLLHHKTPLLQRYDTALIYHFPENQQVVLRCWENGTWISTAKKLEGNGLIYNSSKCLLTADASQALPQMMGNTETTLDATKLYVPDRTTIVTNHELRTLEDAIPSEIAQLDDVRSHLVTPRRDMELDSFLRTSRNTYHREQNSARYFTTIVILCSMIFLIFVGYLLRSYWHTLILHCFVRRRTPIQSTSAPCPGEHDSNMHSDATACDSSDPERTVTFSTYSLRPDA
jgi:hypothetical protein